VGWSAVTAPIGTEVLAEQDPTTWRATFADTPWKVDIGSHVPWAGTPNAFPAQPG
jgi:hypothetical protein